ncbi:SANT/Myb_domain [Hexamita inflata]|uniref:SANT/Myb domain n=1 Tax=Hexamita inflata TaxID=28002 RepID=A0AA86UY40_9EUKA|nr:SANT/Myb domain [Hexamita inflata]
MNKSKIILCFWSSDFTFSKIIIIFQLQPCSSQIQIGSVLLRFAASNIEIRELSWLQIHTKYPGDLVKLQSLFIDLIQTVMQAQTPNVEIRSQFHFFIMVRTITRWTQEETALLLKLVQQYRNNFKLVASVFPSRSYNQVKGHYFNVQNRIKSFEEQNTSRVIQQMLITTAAPSFDSKPAAKSKASENLDEASSFYSFQDFFE